jgi:hypothetical protein
MSQREEENPAQESEKEQPEMEKPTKGCTAGIQVQNPCYEEGETIVSVLLI